MKKFLLLMAAFSFAFMLAACGRAETFEIAMITDAGDIDDESFNQGTWEGIVAFAEANNKTYAYYRPAEISDAAYLNAIDLAISAGARIVITPGFLFMAAIGEAQAQHPDVKFVLIDAVPTGGTGSNTVSILFAEHESGFLAGYAAVRDGYRDLGFMGGIAVPAVVRFGIGFIAGVYYAANELDVLGEIVFPNNRFAYLGNFDASDAHRTRALSWFEGGTELIFVAAGGAGSSVMSAAEARDGAKVIGVDVDQGPLSETVITSAMKDLASAVDQMLTAFFADEFPGGQVLTLDASNAGVALPDDFSRFNSFTQAQYQSIFNRIASGEIDVPSSHAELVSFLDDLNILDVLEITADTTS